MAFNDRDNFTEHALSRFRNEEFVATTISYRPGAAHPAETHTLGNLQAGGCTLAA
jgi:hypothetical protein